MESVGFFVLIAVAAGIMLLIGSWQGDKPTNVSPEWMRNRAQHFDSVIQKIQEDYHAALKIFMDDERIEHRVDSNTAHFVNYGLQEVSSLDAELKALLTSIGNLTETPSGYTEARVKPVAQAMYAFEEKLAMLEGKAASARAKAQSKVARAS